jgi:hypothetical protein
VEWGCSSTNQPDSQVEQDLFFAIIIAIVAITIAIINNKTQEISILIAQILALCPQGSNVDLSLKHDI